MATLLRFGDPPDTRGGAFEEQCAETLAKKLPAEYTVLTNVSLPTRQSNFYELDLIIASPTSYDILECKLIHPRVDVGEDFLRSTGNFCIDNVFSPLQNKCRVLNSRLKEPPFSDATLSHPKYCIIVPDESQINFVYQPHKDNRKVLRLRDYIREITTRPKPRPATGLSIKDQWQQYKTKYQSPSERRDGHKINRFLIKRRIETADNSYAYKAIDEPPCKVDVHLLEIPFPEGMKGTELDQYLEESSRAMAALRRLRHPLIHCVTGHFYTGSSLIQVSDWFDGQTLEQVFENQRLSLDDKLQVMSQIGEALVYCHQKEIFHRNIHPANILMAGNCNDLQLTGFGCVKDTRQNLTAMPTELGKRDKRIIPPEEVEGNQNVNYRLYDIFQAGVLFYWILEDGKWPFESAIEYVTGSGKIDFQGDSDPRYDELKQLITQMLEQSSGKRPDPFQRILHSLEDINSLSRE